MARPSVISDGNLVPGRYTRVEFTSDDYLSSSGIVQPPAPIGDQVVDGSGNRIVDGSGNRVVP